MQRAEQLHRGFQEDHNRFFHSIQRTLHAEIVRKLRLATELEEKDDREIVCSEIFADITGELDERAQGHLKTAGEIYFYELLSPFYGGDWPAAETLLAWCRGLWGQPYVAPVYALLLHKWLLLNRDAGGSHERVKHVKVLVQASGADNLICQVLTSLKKISSEPVLLRYLQTLETLQGNSVFHKLDEVTRVKLQAELYALTSPGGPRYPPEAVRRSASRVLDELFPNGAVMRRFVSLIFRFLHPEDWPLSRRMLTAASSAASVAMQLQWYVFILWKSIVAMWLAIAGRMLSRR